PDVLAEKIRQLIVCLPAFVTPEHGSRSEPIHIVPLTHLDAPSCPPAPPPSAIRINDQHLINVLSDPLIMNGGKHPTRPTVWSVLLSLAPPGSHQEHEIGIPSTSPNPPDTSLMLYLPLQPNTHDAVELAESKHIPVVLLNPTVEEHVDGVTAGWKWWPFHSTKKEQIPEIPKIASQTSPTPGVPRSSVSSIPTKAVKKVWLPSRTKCSIEATWWGYRIFLPPPVMAALNNDEMTLAKRAAMVSAALAWLFTQIPLAVLPPPVQPLVLVLQKIVPYISYIGTFISWSWETVKEYDTGYGVILNATWLLPVALLPSTWT
ncbi:hypothetical protein EV368DRAFT_11483, partial [Lentinula lateritia]